MDGKKIAAARAMREMAPTETPAGLYDEFCARFPYAETEDQQKAIADVIEDLAKGKPMDRLVCGDVGFGKTEVALRAAFVVAMSGMQVAVVVPTTLLARQHARTFAERFAGLPVRIGQLSRLVSAKDAAALPAYDAAIERAIDRMDVIVQDAEVSAPRDGDALVARRREAEIRAFANDAQPCRHESDACFEWLQRSIRRAFAFRIDQRAITFID